MICLRFFESLVTSGFLFRRVPVKLFHTFQILFDAVDLYLELVTFLIDFGEQIHFLGHLSRFESFETSAREL